MNFSGKHIAITGAGSGLGRALAISLHAQGALLYLSDINEEGLHETKAMLSDSVQVQVVDVSSLEAVEDWKASILTYTSVLDILINNAGVTVLERFEEHSIADWEWVFGVNVWGVIYGSRTFLPMLQQAKKGWIVNISSIFGIIALPGQAAYCASKFAIRGLSEVMWEEFSDVGVSVVHPGGIATNIVTKSRSQHDDYKGALERFFARHSLKPEEAVRQILAGLQKEKKRIMVTKEAVLFDRVKRLSPIKGNHWCVQRIFQAMGVKRLADRDYRLKT